MERKKRWNDEGAALPRRRRNDEARRHLFQELEVHLVIDVQLITSQNPASVGSADKLLIDTLKANGK
jgi:hypothetical protein